MAKKLEICGLHCSKWMMWLFGLVSLWFVVSPFGVPTFGGFWAWMVFLSGVCSWVCTSNPKHQKTSCPFVKLPVWYGPILALIGGWFVLSDILTLPMFGLSLLYLVVFATAVALYQYRR